MKEPRVIMYESPEAATYRTNVKGWVSGDGMFFGESESTARWHGCTHRICKCGKICDKSRIVCDSCFAKERTEKYYSLPVEAWDGTTPVCLFDDDRYFFDEDSLLDYMNDLLEDAEGKDYELEIQAVLCEPQYLHLVDRDDWCDDLAEDGELSDAVEVALEALNAVIKEQGPSCWTSGNVRIDIEALWKQLKEDLVKEKLRQSQ